MRNKSRRIAADLKSILRRSNVHADDLDENSRNCCIQRLHGDRMY